MSDNICPVCDAKSAECFRCSECGKLLTGDDESGSGSSTLGGAR